ncbi:MAG TPA: guanylate kinase [Microbacteriaceae bacterium]|nr:guanylate kinase [Microbacteriaceae bacterium]HPZ35534.1 guanylate kinase [Microbacteriaceae bacterium]HQC92594.1 guanylate kinase [Microbacteriaceae bacterium]
MVERQRPPEVDRVAASRKAVAARRARASLKRDINTRVITPQEALRRALVDADSAAGTLRVTEFLTSIPGVGASKRDRVLEQLAISPVKRLGGLGARQRAALGAYLGGRRAEPVQQPARSRLMVLAGPTAVGKGTVAAWIREQYPEVALSVSTTTRAPRPGEVEGVHYFFVDDAEFDRLIADGELLEWATVHNAHRYGTPRGPVQEALAAGRTVLLEIDIQGAHQIRAAEPSAALVFLLPPSWDELVDRLVGRGTEDEDERRRRLRTAVVELKDQDSFDFRVINDDVARAAKEVVELAQASARGEA